MGIGRRLTWLATASLALSAAGARARATNAAAAPRRLKRRRKRSTSRRHRRPRRAGRPGPHRSAHLHAARRSRRAKHRHVRRTGRIPRSALRLEGDVTLLGADNVTIQINGQPVPGDNLEQILRGLTGAEVERIEVITNPSAQYSAEASGGIINIITRQRVDAASSGSACKPASTRSAAITSASRSDWSRGPWSLSGGSASISGESRAAISCASARYPSEPGDDRHAKKARSTSPIGWL